jgi:hypothetical protein
VVPHPHRCGERALDVHANSEGTYDLRGGIAIVLGDRK